MEFGDLLARLPTVPVFEVLAAAVAGGGHEEEFAGERFVETCGDEGREECQEDHDVLNLILLSYTFNESNLFI